MRAETRVEQRETPSKKVVQRGSPTIRLLAGLPCRTTFFESKIESSGKNSSLSRFRRPKSFSWFSQKQLVRVITRKTGAPPSGGVLTCSPLACYRRLEQNFTAIAVTPLNASGFTH